MGTILEIVHKFLEKQPLFAAGALTAITVLLLRQVGFLTDLKEEANWLYVFGIFCGWVVANNATKAVSRFLKRSTRRIAAWLSSRRNAAVRLSALSNDQNMYLMYIRANENRHFQAWDQDDVIGALRSMGLIIAHETTEHMHSRYEVPKYVWKRIRLLTAAEKKQMPRRPPWETKLRSGRI